MGYTPRTSMIKFPKFPYFQKLWKKRSLWQRRFIAERLFFWTCWNWNIFFIFPNFQCQVLRWWNRTFYAKHVLSSQKTSFLWFVYALSMLCITFPAKRRRWQVVKTPILCAKHIYKEVLGAYFHFRNHLRAGSEKFAEVLRKVLRRPPVQGASSQKLSRGCLEHYPH